MTHSKSKDPAKAALPRKLPPFREPGTLLDVTTILGAADGLGLLAHTRHLRATSHLIMSVAQFAEAVVVQDRLYFEEGTGPSWQPYRKVLDEVNLERYVGKDLLHPAPSTAYTDAVMLEAIRWAVGKVNELDPGVLRLPADARESCYRGMQEAKGIKDAASPFSKDYPDLIQQSGDSKLAQAYRRALSKKGAAFPSLNVLIRLFYFHTWLATEPRWTYSPHYSRIPLVQNTLAKRGDVSARRWALAHVQERYAEIFKDHTAHSEQDPWALAFPPIFLACIAKARHPIDVLENALQMRETRQARAFRQACRTFEGHVRDDTASELAFRADMKRTLANLDEIVRTQASTIKLVAKLLGRPPFFNAEVTFEKAITIEPHAPGVMFMANILQRSLQVFDVRDRLVQVFGEFDEPGDYLWQRDSR